jgi:fluoride exporter
LLRQLGEAWPWGTFVANMIGALAVGAVFVWLEGKGASASYWRAFLIVGVLGGLTTYSALMLECLRLAKMGA